MARIGSLELPVFDLPVKDVAAAKSFNARVFGWSPDDFGPACAR